MADTNGRGRVVVTALIYTRVSSDEQARDGLSLDTQLADCRRYVASKDGWVIGAEYQDVLKGTRDDRPDYQRLLQDARRLRAEGPVAVVVARLDRFGRKLLERVRSRDEFKRLGVTMHSVREGEVNDMMAGFLALLAEDEVRRLGERVSDVRQHLAGNGWKLPGRAPWGYRWRPATPEERAEGAPVSVLDIDSLTGPYAREMFQRAAAGQSVRAIAAWVAGLPSDVRARRNLRYACLRNLLAAPVYVARLEVHSEPDILARPQGRWPALVDDHTFRLARERIRRHARLPRQASGPFLLTGLIRCRGCGARMNGDRAAGRQTHRYRCSGPFGGAKAPNISCSGTALGPAVEAAVRAVVGRLVDAMLSGDPSVQAALRRAWAGLEARQAAPAERSRQHELERLADRARERLKAAALALVDGELDRTGYELVREQAETDLQAAGAELERLRAPPSAPALPPLADVVAAACSWHALMEDSDSEVLRPFLADVVEAVVPERMRIGRYRVHITWTPTGELLRRLAKTADAA